MQYTLDKIDLRPHATARTQAKASAALSAGATLLKTPALMSALISSEKGRRCDHCHVLSSDSRKLFKCSGCAAFWYCGTACQAKQWKAHHRRLCKRYNRYTATADYQALSLEQRTDAVLLSQLIAQIFAQGDFDIAAASSRSESVAQFFDLLKGPSHSQQSSHPPVCASADVPQSVIDEAFARFGNNNFLLQSHLTAYAHGIFPLASRLFNHSCVPNCAAKYITTPTEMVSMEIVALRDIAPDEELTVPYLDPALPLDIRQGALQTNYGFTCVCELCTFQQAQVPIPHLPSAPEDVHTLEQKLCEFVASHVLQLDPCGQSPAGQGRDVFSTYPSELNALLNDSYLPTLSEQFSKASHEGDYVLALSSGRTLLALYAVVYPPNYPQIGMHALELTKTTWNAIIAGEQSGELSNTAAVRQLEDAARHYLALASRVLEVYGPEGDEGGPLEELRIMRSLLEQ